MISFNDESEKAVVSAAEADTFQEEGVVVLRGMFDAAWLELLADGISANFKEPGPFAKFYTPSGNTGSFYGDYCNWQRISQYERFIRESPAGGLVAQLMASHNVRFFHEHVLVKEAGTAEKTPWHHDLPYYFVDGDQLCSIWLPIDPVAKAACPEFVAGSHRWGRLFTPRKFLDHKNYDYEVGAYEDVPDIDANRADYTIRQWSLEPGDCIVFHMRTLHAAPGTQNAQVSRRAFSTRWLGDDAVYADRPGETSPPFPDLHYTAGQPVVDSRFPVIYQA